MDDLGNLALDAALRLDQAARGRLTDPGPVAVLGLRYASPELRSAPRHRAAHRIALAAIGHAVTGEESLHLALAEVGGDLSRAAAEPEVLALQARCREFCLALHEGLRRAAPDAPA